MRHIGLRLAAAAGLLALPLTFTACGSTCGCASTPDPNWTPPPVTAQQALDETGKFVQADGSSQPAGLQASLVPFGKGLVYVVSSLTVDAVVDADTETVLEYVLVDAMPNSVGLATSADSARTTAASFLKARGLDTVGMAATVVNHSAGGAADYVVTWTAPAWDPAGVSVLVNPSSGAVFAFVDERFGVAIIAPTIGATAATTLAKGAAAIPGLVLQSADFRFGPDGSSWDILMTADPDHFAAVTVDAVTGAATVNKSS